MRRVQKNRQFVTPSMSDERPLDSPDLVEPAQVVVLLFRLDSGLVRLRSEGRKCPF